MVTQPLSNVKSSSSLDPDIKQTSFYVPLNYKEDIYTWCDSHFGVKARYPRGRWTSFPFYLVANTEAIRIVIYHVNDIMAFRLVWAELIISVVEDYK